MKYIKNFGLVMLIGALLIWVSSAFVGSFSISEQDIKSQLSERQWNAMKIELQDRVVDHSFSSSFSMGYTLRNIYDEVNERNQQEQNWDLVMYASKQDIGKSIVAKAMKSPVQEQSGLWLFLTFGLAFVGGLVFVIPNVWYLGKAGIKNHHVFQEASTNRGWVGWLVFVWLVGFYVLLYFHADLIVPWYTILDPAAMFVKNQAADQWFMYGVIYCTCMTVMGIRMIIKYRHSRYQVVRTCSVLFFQIAIAFLLAELLVRFNMPYYDFKNIWPLDYQFFFDWNLQKKAAAGSLGIFMIVWGVALVVIGVPVFVYFFGKRWYCSWVCGCGGLAETLGDPYRQLSDKSMKAWKIERYLIHSVLVFAVIMTGMALYSMFAETEVILGFKTQNVQKTYGFLSGSVFSGVIGTGFYPVMGSRVWCRFGCPLAAYLGLVQRFKSRFRI
ncbi:MAG: 4Fe-4S binding protein, partial [Bacteroidota bacterium]